MRLLLPGVRLRRQIDDALVRFFHGHQDPDFDKAVRLFCHFYQLTMPKITWYEYLAKGHVLGQCDEETGQIDLIYPPHWITKKLGSDRMWVRVALHELAHYVLWADAERKAWQFADRFVGGLNSRNRRRAA